MDKRKACLAAAAALSLSLSTGFAAGDGVYAATAKGFGGDVTVTLSIQDGKLVDVTAEGAAETDGVGSRAIELMPGAMLVGNTVETDGVSGATVTSTAILEAAKAALAESDVTLTAQQADVEQHMTPGTYVGEAYGKWKKGSIEGERFGSPAIIQPTQVAVTVDETSILKVEVRDCSDTPGFTDPCIERIPAAIVEQQSIAVDTVTGATLTSQAILVACSRRLSRRARTSSVSASPPKR